MFLGTEANPELVHESTDKMDSCRAGRINMKAQRGVIDRAIHNLSPRDRSREMKVVTQRLYAHVRHLSR